MHTHAHAERYASATGFCEKACQWLMRADAGRDSSWLEYNTDLSEQRHNRAQDKQDEVNLLTKDTKFCTLARQI